MKNYFRLVKMSHKIYFLSRKSSYDICCERTVKTKLNAGQSLCLSLAVRSREILSA